MPVPSPTYLLQNVYDELEGAHRACQAVQPRHAWTLQSGSSQQWQLDSLKSFQFAADLPIHHFDLYRLSKPEDLRRLRLDQSFKSAVSLIEWAERLGNQLPAEHLAVRLRILKQV